ncbi:MAG: AAA family ATPase [Oscillospiraceae bacterium]|nr:AAA family ATPase [Oscillospiraceae bacterium]
MKLVFIFGDGAVGKMTVGQELAKITDLRLFHNHMTVELVLDVFGGFCADVLIKLREVIFEAFVETDNYGMIFTGMWAFDQPSDREYFLGVADFFRRHGADIYAVELYAPLDVRLERNVSENRLAHKPSKRRVEESNDRVIRHSSAHRFLSHDGELPFEDHMKIDNTHLPPEAVARMIKEKFDL